HGRVRPALAWQEPAAGRRAHRRLGPDDGAVRCGDRSGDRCARTAPPGAARLLDGRTDLPGNGAALGRSPRRRDRLRGERAHRGARSALDAPPGGQRVVLRPRMGARPDGAAKPTRAGARSLVGILAGRLRRVLGRHPLLWPRMGRARARGAHRYGEMPGHHADRGIRLFLHARDLARHRGEDPGRALRSDARHGAFPDGGEPGTVPGIPAPRTCEAARRLMRRFLADFGTTYAANGLVGFIFAATGPVAIILAVGAQGGLSETDLSSWIFGAFFINGLISIAFCLFYRQPLVFFWTIPGAVLVGPALGHLSFPEVIGAFVATGVLMLALGLSGWVRRCTEAAPMPIVMAMVAGVFLRFGTGLVFAVRDELAVAGPMVLAFVFLSFFRQAGRWLPPLIGAMAVGI